MVITNREGDTSMAQRMITQLIDDLDGTVLDDGKGESVTFGYKGKVYIIDLSDKNAKKLEDALKPFIASGRLVKTGIAAASVTRLKSTGPTATAQAQVMRTWGAENGFIVADRGRVSKELRDAYNAAH